MKKFSALFAALLLLSSPAAHAVTATFSQDIDFPEATTSDVTAGTPGLAVTSDVLHSALSGVSTYPSQSGNSGKFLTTDGSSVSWGAGGSSLPSQSGNSGKWLSTDGTTASWGTLPSSTLPTLVTGKWLTNDGTSTSWGDYCTGGTFTPTIYGSTTAGTPTYVIQTGKYEKCGVMVYVSIYLQWSALASAAGELRVGNLPYTSTAYSTMSVHYGGLTVGTGKELEALMLSGDNFIRLQTGDQAGGAAGSIAIDTSVTDLLFSGWYIAS